MNNHTVSPEMAQQGQEILQGMLTRSATDSKFRQKLLTDSTAAISEYTGRKITTPFSVQFIENKADATIVLPPLVDPTAELNEQELEAVAGGATPVIASILSIIASITAIINETRD